MTVAFVNDGTEYVSGAPASSHTVDTTVIPSGSFIVVDIIINSGVATVLGVSVKRSGAPTQQATMSLLDFQSFGAISVGSYYIFAPWDVDDYGFNLSSSCNVVSNASWYSGVSTTSPIADHRVQAQTSTDNYLANYSNQVDYLVRAVCGIAGNALSSPWPSMGAMTQRWVQRLSGRNSIEGDKTGAATFSAGVTSFGGPSRDSVLIVAKLAPVTTTIVTGQVNMGILFDMAVAGQVFAATARVAMDIVFTMVVVAQPIAKSGAVTLPITFDMTVRGNVTPLLPSHIADPQASAEVPDVPHGASGIN